MHAVLRAWFDDWRRRSMVEDSRDVHGRTRRICIAAPYDSSSHVRCGHQQFRRPPWFEKQVFVRVDDIGGSECLSVKV